MDENKYRLMIPERYKEGIERLATITDEGFDAIAAALKTTSPTFKLEEQISNLASKSGQINEEDAAYVIEVLISLFSLVEEGLSLEEIAVELPYSIKYDEHFTELTDEDATRLGERLSACIEFKHILEVSYKAHNLSTEHERLFVESRILTDIRPVFTSSSVEDPNLLDAALIVHTLRVAYRDAEGDKEFFVTLDSVDLQKLYEQLDRAVTKESILKSKLKQARIQYLEPFSSVRTDELEEE